MTGGLADLHLRGRYLAYDDRVNEFYLPVLSRAVRYDRLVGYWRSSSLVVAAPAIAELARRRGSMRIIAGAQLTDEDIVAIRHGRPLDDAVAQRLIAEPDEAGDLVADHRYQVLAWLLAEGLLEVRIGVPVDPNGVPLPPSDAGRLFHSKFGVVEDEYGQQVAFDGSSNESASGWRTNHESFSVFCSWKSPDTWMDHGYPIVVDFERHWTEGAVPGWQVIPFPDEARDHLLDRVPAADEWIPPPDPEVVPLVDAEVALRRIVDAPAAEGGTGVGFVTLPIDPWPHQAAIAARVLDTWPRSYLFADEVGLGKTIEAGLVIRELLLSGKASKILLLVPASVQRQWQEELWEKFTLDVPSYDRGRFVNASLEEVPLPAGMSPWSAFPVVLASSHLARRRDRREELLAAGPWDLIVVDEAHHARRRGSGGTEGANQLLQLLRALRDADAATAMILASATPMQMNTSDVYDLLELFGLPGTWAAGEHRFEQYYRQLAEPDPLARDWALLQGMLADFLTDPDTAPNQVASRDLGRLPRTKAMRIEGFHRRPPNHAQIAARAPEDRQMLDRWLRVNTPLRDRVFRTTRTALREYQRLGILPADATIPVRVVHDTMIPLDPATEKPLYDRIESYITRHYEKYNADQGTKPLGFIMTVYRRRLTSSFHAVHRSLQRRLGALEAGHGDLLDDDDRIALEGGQEEPEALDTVRLDLASELNELRAFVADLETAVHGDTKVARLKADLRAALAGGHATVVVFTQYTDTLDWLKEELRAEYGENVACYSGKGGERWSSASGGWVTQTKGEIKDLFRSQQVRILLGTDAMSEGLNLQTCDRLINFDMPWNFMRVEQRIGRIDRIGGKPTVTITNYFYSGTVEEQVYTGIAEDADWFQQVVGPAQPVLATVETVINKLAMQSADAREVALQQELAEVRHAIAAAGNRPVDLSDMESTEPPPPGGYAAAPTITLDDIEHTLTTNPLTRTRLRPHPTLPRTYHVDVVGKTTIMTFDRTVYDQHADIGFMTYGHPVFDELVGREKGRGIRPQRAS